MERLTSEFPLRGPPGSFHESNHEELGIWSGRFYHLIERRTGGSRETKIGPLVAGQDIDRHTRSSDCKYGSHAESVNLVSTSQATESHGAHFQGR